MSKDRDDSFQSFFVPVPPYTDMGDAPLPTPATIVITPDDCQDDGDDLPFGPPTPDPDDDEDDDVVDHQREEETGANRVDDDPPHLPSSAPCPAIPRVKCKPLAHDGAAIYSFDCFEANNLKHPVATGVAVYREGELASFGCMVESLGSYRLFLKRECPVKVEHDEKRYSWLQCQEMDRGLMMDICTRLTADRNVIFKDGDADSLRLARYFGLL